MDNLTHLLKEKDRTAARVVGAAINAIRFWECQDYETAYRILKPAVDSHQKATRDYIEFLSRSSERKENQNGNRSAA
ncbi:MAG TPA: hypothetical protein VMQ17_08950 [Candidatus Sulfotelmatobacter sp.]|nr:hypothetical protein [Candidatus Sulfotelmatobacter sp.]